ncbi:MAG: rhombosortase [Verrucomicrobiota bacterium]
MNFSKPDSSCRKELIWFGVALGLVNLPLLLGLPAVASFTFLPSRFLDGEWWRLLTHPLVHVTWYHLLLDASAFFLLYFELGKSTRTARLFYVGGSMFGALLGCLWFAPSIHEIGLCGLSGLAHGLMAILALESITSHQNRERGFGIFCLVVLLAKCAWEVFSGSAFLELLHFGLVGTPLVACHAGGVIGGVLAFAMIFIARRGKDSSQD